jgi:hypothetical protein
MTVFKAIRRQHLYSTHHRNVELGFKDNATTGVPKWPVETPFNETPYCEAKHAAHKACQSQQRLPIECKSSPSRVWIRYMPLSYHPNRAWCYLRLCYVG